MPDNNIHANHRSRMRKRYKEQGLDGFHDHEVLEILLYYCYPRCDTNQIAHKMLKEFKTLDHLFESSVETLMTRLNCTEKIATLISLMPAIAKRYHLSKWRDKISLDNAEAAGTYSTSLFVGDVVENFYILCLNAQMQLNHAALVAKGTIDEVAIFAREIVAKTLEYKASYVVLAHNHPGGTIAPSGNDNVLTSKVRNTLNSIDVKVLDHIIVAGDKFYSYAQRSRQHVDGYV